MKYQIVNTILFFSLLIIVSLGSCATDDDSEMSLGQTQLEIEFNIMEGNWRISKFIDSGEDETNHFIGFNFIFNSNGTLTASNGNIIHNGKWRIISISQIDDNLDNLDFNIQFDINNDFESLDDDWDFVSQTSTKIELIDVSGGNGGTDYLTFEKN